MVHDEALVQPRIGKHSASSLSWELPATQPLMTQEQLAHAVSSAVSRRPPVLHVCRERDVGLFSLIQQVVANVPWALGEGRVPVADFRERTCYWTPIGHRGGTSVWEYYFEPLVAGYPSAAIPEDVNAAIAWSFPDQGQVGHFVGDHAFVSNHFGDHPSLRGKAPVIPYVTGNPSRAFREWTSQIIHSFVRPRGHIERKVDAYFNACMRGHEVIGVHVRGTDAVSASETRKYRQGSLDLGRFVDELTRLLEKRREAKVFVATDAEASLQFMVGATCASTMRVACAGASRAAPAA